MQDYADSRSGQPANTHWDNVVSTMSNIMQASSKIDQHVSPGWETLFWTLLRLYKKYQNCVTGLYIWQLRSE